MKVEFEVTHVVRHHGDIDVVTLRPTARPGQRAALDGSSFELKVEKGSAEVGSLLYLTNE